MLHPAKPSDAGMDSVHNSRSRGTPGTHLGPHSGRPCGVVPQDSSRVRPQSTGTVSHMVKVEGALVPRSSRPTRAPARGSERADLPRDRPRTCSVIPARLLARRRQHRRHSFAKCLRAMATFACLLAKFEPQDVCDCSVRADVRSLFVRSSGLKTTSFKEEAVLDGARSARGGDEATPQFDHAPHDEGAPRPARRTARDRSLRSSATPASPDPPRGGDPSAPRARAPSLTHKRLTAYAWSTFWQA